jgi:hypothetical protein
MNTSRENDRQNVCPSMEKKNKIKKIIRCGKARLVGRVYDVRARCRREVRVAEERKESLSFGVWSKIELRYRPRPP